MVIALPITEKTEYTIPLPIKFVSFLGDKKVQDVLDVGCGYGRTSFFLYENGYHVMGIDFDKAQVALALREANSRGITKEICFLINDARCLCFRNSSFDAVTMVGIITLVSKPNRIEVINEIKRVLRPLGYLFIEEFGQTWENSIYSRRYRDDLPVTGELGTFTVKDEHGRVLHLAHHFTREELLVLLRNFNIISFEEDMFTSYYHKNWVKGYVIIAQKIS